MSARERDGVMTRSAAGPVVVGIGDPPGSPFDSALEFAAQQAQRRHVGIRLVHGCDPLMTPTSLEPGPSLVTRQRAAERMLQVAARSLRRRTGPMVDVDWSVSPGTGVQTLLDESRTAAMLVLQRRVISTLGRMHTGSTTGRTASRAACPVAVVRAGHTDGADRSGVVVELDSNGTAGLALREAIAEAEMLSEPLIVIPAWSEPTEASADGMADEPEELRARQDRARLDLSEALAGVRSDHPDLEIRHEMLEGDLADRLLKAAATARLLVVPRRRTGHAGSMALGGVAWRCIRAADCPVVVTPPAVQLLRPSPPRSYLQTGPTY